MTSRAAAALAAGSLVAGFAVAELTGVRALGGLVLVAAALGCARVWWRTGRLTAVGLVVLYAAAFVVAHPLARVVGAWPSVLAVSAAVGLVALAATRAPARTA